MSTIRTWGRVTLTLTATLWLSGVLCACDEDAGSSSVDAGDGEVASAGQALVRGRVTDVDGQPVADLDVVSEGASVRTDPDGRFELAVPADQAEVRIEVDSREYSSAELPVRISQDAPANVEMAVKPRRRVMLPDAARGGRVQGDDGFAVTLPARALRTREDAEVQGEVEVRYALVNRPREVTAAPGRMQARSEGGLDGYGMAEVRFYQDGERLELREEMTLEVPLLSGHGLHEGQELDQYALGRRDLRWRRGTRGTVRGDHVELRTASDEWVGAARELPVDSCVTGRLGTELEARITNTTVRAARERGLSLVQGDTGDDGSFCLPVTPNDDWRVSTFYDDGRDGFALEVPLNSSDATGMCGGTGCKDVGDVQLPRLARP